MCDYATAAMAVIAIATTAVSYSAAQQQASQQAARDNTQIALNQQNNEFQQRQGAVQEYNTNISAYQKLRQSQQQTEAGAATAKTAAGEAGVTGTSIDDLQREYYLRQGEFQKDVNFNRNAADADIQTQLAGGNLRVQSEDNQLTPPNYPSTLGLILGIAGDGASAYSGYKTRNPNPPSGGSGNP